MRYVSEEWQMGDLARISTRSDHIDDTVVRMLIVQSRGHLADMRVWWGPRGYIDEESILDIEPVTALTNEELNRRREMSPDE